MFNWLIKLCRRKPSREIRYFWTVPKKGRVVLTGYAKSVFGMHLAVVLLGKQDVGHHLVPKGIAVDPKHWQELWNEFNRGNKLEWADPPGTTKAGDGT